MHSLRWCLVLATAVAVVACEEESTLPVAGEVDLRDYLIAPGGDSVGAITFTVDSTTYDPAANGTAIRSSRQIWSLAVVEEDAPDERLYLVRKFRDGKPAGSQYWRWGTLDENRGLTNTLDGVTYLSLVQPLTVGTAWDATALTDPDLIVDVEAEPIALHKDWSARLDSVGMYTRINDTPIKAVYVTHADSENSIELRRVREVYGEGLGLLERSVDILDTQNFTDLPWEQKAERGFQVRLQRTP